MADYEPPDVWTWDRSKVHRFSDINRPEAGPTHDRALPVGAHPPALLAGHPQRDEGHHPARAARAGARRRGVRRLPINIMDGEQFGSGFVEANPNSKIPALMDHSTDPPTRVFESGAILLYWRSASGPSSPRPGGPRGDPELVVLADGCDPLLGAASGTSTGMRRRSWSTPSIASPWRPNGSWTSWTAGWRQPSSPARRTPSRTWPRGPGTDGWPAASSTAPETSSPSPPTPTCCAGTTRSRSARGAAGAASTARARGHPECRAARGP